MTGMTTLSRRRNGAAEGQGADRMVVLERADREARKGHMQARARELLQKTEGVRSSLARGEKPDKLKVIELRDSVEELLKDDDTVLIRSPPRMPGISRIRDDIDGLHDALKDLNIVITGWALALRVGYSLGPAHESP